MRQHIPKNRTHLSDHIFPTKNCRNIALLTQHPMKSLVFVGLLVCSILFAYLVRIITDIYVSPLTIHTIVHVLIFLIFFVCGIISPFEKFDKTENFAKFILFVQIFSFLVYPAIGIILGSFLALFKFNNNLLIGFMVNKSLN